MLIVAAGCAWGTAADGGAQSRHVDAAGTLILLLLLCQSHDLTVRVLEIRLATAISRVMCEHACHPRSPIVCAFLLGPFHRFRYVRDVTGDGAVDLAALHYDLQGWGRGARALVQAWKVPGINSKLLLMYR